MDIDKLTESQLREYLRRMIISVQRAGDLARWYQDKWHLTRDENKSLRVQIEDLEEDISYLKKELKDEIRWGSGGF